VVWGPLAGYFADKAAGDDGPDGGKPSLGRARNRRLCSIILNGSTQRRTHALARTRCSPSTATAKAMMSFAAYQVHAADARRNGGHTER